MAFVEDLSVFFADFAVDATLNALPLRAIVDTSSLVELDGVVTQVPAALVKSSDAASAAPGQAFVASSICVWQEGYSSVSRARA